MYILNEREYIENIIDSNSKPNDLSISYLFQLLANYYYCPNIDVTYQLVLSKLNEMNIVGYQEYKYANKIKEICYDIPPGNSFKCRDYIPVFKDEIDIISSLPTDRHKKFLFTLIVIARYMDCNGWVNKKDIKGKSELFKLSNIHSSIKDGNNIIRDLKDMGYIELAKANDNLNMRVTIESNMEDIAYKLTEFTNIGNQYIGNFKKGWKQCKCCGKKLRANSRNNNLYCPECAKKMNVENTKNRMKTLRNSQVFDF